MGARDPNSGPRLCSQLTSPLSYPLRPLAFYLNLNFMQGLELGGSLGLSVPFPSVAMLENVFSLHFILICLFKRAGKWLSLAH